MTSVKPPKQPKGAKAPRFIVEAGAIAVRIDRLEPHFLLVTSRAPKEEWIFPKGHIEPGESPVAAAQRELYEEAGVVARPLGEVGVLRFAAGGEQVQTVYFLFDRVSEEPAGEGRRKIWLGAEAARQQLSFPDARALLEKAVHMVEALRENY